MNKIWEFVKANHKKLNSCKQHNFEDITPDKKLDKKYKCKNCGGELDGINVSYYHLGLKHGNLKNSLEDNEILLGWHSNIACWIMDNLGIVDYNTRNDLAKIFIKRFFDIDYNWKTLVETGSLKNS